MRDTNEGNAAFLEFVIATLTIPLCNVCEVNLTYHIYIAPFFGDLHVTDLDRITNQNALKLVFGNIRGYDLSWFPMIRDDFNKHN